MAGSGVAGSETRIDLVPPCPAGSELTFDMVCGPRSSTRARTHPVTLRKDWSVDTGHDDDAERVAAALGGYRICRDRLDTLVPALQEALTLWTRSRLPAVIRVEQQWVVRQEERVTGCACRRHKRFADVVAAAAHLRSAEHAARRHRVDQGLLEILLAAALDAHGGLRSPPPHPVAAWVREPGGLADLWQAGLHPDNVAGIREAYWEGDEPLPAQFYLAVALLRPPESYLREVIAATEDPDVATWAALSVRPDSRDDVQARGYWLSLRLPRSDVEELLAAGRTVDEVRRVVEATGQSLRQGARQAAAWARAGCRPDPVQLGALSLVDGWQVPSGAAVDRLLRELGAVLSEAPGRTVAGLVLAATGSVPAARAAFANPTARPDLTLLFVDPEGPR
jgi:hypothetical protein